MSRHLLRLLTMVAVLMVPFGMAAAPAAPSGGHTMSASTATEHCPESNPAEALGDGPADCAMPCSAAVPADAVAAVKSNSIVQAAAERRFEGALAGILLEIATPPPKLD
ncbi:MAG: hypothetical protein H0X53_00500 [Sphingomonas sp.]|nr:hypothetical protein [Sphingomonas sp.]